MKFNQQLIGELSKNKYISSLPNFNQKKTRELTTIVLTLVALSIFGLFAISPTLSTIAQLQREFADSKDVDERLRQKIVNITQLQRQYGDIQLDIPVIEDALPASPRPSELIAQTQTLASSSNVTLSRMQTFQADLLQKIDPSKNPSYVVSLSAVGSQENINNFLKDLVNFQRILTIDSLFINNGPDASGLVEISIRGRAHFRP